MDMRTTFGGASSSELSGVVMRALTMKGGLNVRNFREPGFRLLEGAVDALAEAEGLRTAAPLPDRAQIQLDNAVVMVGEDRLNVVKELLDRGLTYTLSNPLSVTQLEWYAANKTATARRVMTPSDRGENFMPDRLPYRLPIYLTMANFELDIRTLLMSRRMGMPLDTANISSGTRAVNEAIEDAMINGATTIDGQDMKVAGYSAYGLVNAPNAETIALSLANWVTTPNGAAVFAAVQSMLSLLRANKKFGPYILVLPTNVGASLDSDYAAAKGDNTIKDRVMKITEIVKIVSSDMMPATKVVLFQATNDVVDVVVGQSPTVIPWTSADGFTFHNAIMAIMVPRVRSDYNGDSGVVVGTLA